MSVLSEAVMQSVVKNYVENNRPKVKAENAWYASLPTLESAVRAAAATSDGKASKSPRRSPAESLKLAEEKLVGQLDQLQSYKTFDALLEGIERAVLPIPGLNDVYAYDTARRIGAYLNIMPKHVYLFTSTRTGAKQLGIVSKKRLLLCTSLPAAFQELEPYEAEDALSNLKKLITEPAATSSYFTQGRE
ncbi:MAG: hypothetical protein IPG71_03150 [bacterium]|nr:hypothetical protein [bacterium]